ncbi:ATP-dependent helicase [Solirubrobacter phytolaccae]|uniref:DNA 3'-5' helicase n=1 Tax=Solirubrobacter phytolaccae TaxID=1404360 RepID=A0A9X3NB43_9ACTN|nr:ATP-dependent helicase [Solirubrobacter phytolaccae]MDA0182849.1 ATP-dependent helicase [Solirubrobacter phytolaccae]
MPARGVRVVRWEAAPERFAGTEPVALLGVRLETLADVRRLHETFLVSALRSGVPVLVECDVTPDELEDAAFVEPGFEHAHTLERLRWLYARAIDGDPRFAGASGIAPHRPLDASQLAAARAPGGVVQVIAPAGSGKTTVLVERVRELLARGADAERVLCMTFNDPAAAELRERLGAAGAGRVAARTFHSVGRRIIAEAGMLEGRELHHGWTVPQWARFARQAAAEVGGAVPEPAELPGLISAIRLGELMSPDEWEAACPQDEPSRVVARAYALVEREKARGRLYDFDDMIVHAVRLLRANRGVRQRWQAAFEHVLVDEYQDIEPAQELLVRMLAAPHDELFVVGDEDQTLYGWRRASVKTMLELSTAFPALTRVALRHNYRCTPEVVRASAALIARNRRRFAKPIEPAPGREDGGERAIRVARYPESTPGAAPRLLARKLAAYGRGEIVVLGRTINALRPFALAAADAGVRIAGPEELFESAGAQETLEAYFAVLAAPRAATEVDVRVILRRPSRGFGLDAAARVVGALARGVSLPAAVEQLPDEGWKVTRAAEQLAALVTRRDAAAVIRQLRADGLDRYFDEVARASARPDRDDRKVLDEAEEEARGQSVADYAAVLDSRRLSLRRARDERGGIELTTVHRAKGRQWPRVVVVACDEGVLPHRNALNAPPDLVAAGEGVEAERRIAYVAFTRATEELSILHTEGRHSRFLHDAGIVSEPATIAAATKPKPEAPPSRAGFWEPPPLPAVGKPASTDDGKAIELAAAALKDGTATDGTVGEFLSAIDVLTDKQRDRLLRAVPGLGPDQDLTALPAKTRRSLAATLRVLARR